MDHKDLLKLLEEVVKGSVHPEVAAEKLARGPFRRDDELGFANLDHHRSIRHHLGEVVYGESKTCEQLLAIVERFAASAAVPVLSTRLNDEKRAALRERFPQGRENAAARTFTVHAPAVKTSASKIDGVQKASAVVAVAGMEGALPSVVAGLVRAPVFAVPTSVGYGASFGGLAALLAMLNTCAPGVTVSNIDNGFSAAYAACNVVRLLREARREGPVS
ncbi:MAG: AIR carboxylase family protein [Deltaproteobacteria bacterium]|nr:AIR carboxylase family protein [Deltaproteobacteria bacterium]